jgi:hypothetical protein
VPEFPIRFPRIRLLEWVASVDQMQGLPPIWHGVRNELPVEGGELPAMRCGQGQQISICQAARGSKALFGSCSRAGSASFWISEALMIASGSGNDNHGA